MGRALESAPEYYVPGFIMTLKISIVGLLVASVSWNCVRYIF